MKKKKIIAIVVAAAAVVLVAAFLLTQSLMTNIKMHAAIDPAAYASASDENWTVVNTGTVDLENDTLRFSLDAATTHFTLEDKRNGSLYQSAAVQDAAALDGEDADRLTSELIVTYHNSSFVENYLFSSKHCVAFELAEVKTNGEAVRVYYTIRQSKVKTFAPIAFRQALFEESVIPALSKSYQRRLNLYYNLYRTEDTDEATTQMKSTYPALNNENLYIIRGDVDEAGYAEITKLLTTSGYTEEQYLIDAGELGLEAQEAGMSVGYMIPVEYALTEDGFTAEILSDLIVTDSMDYRMIGIDLLPYFGSLGENAEGYLFVPDGSGGVIDLQEKTGKGFIKRIYGYDGALAGEQSPQLAQNAVLPVFGLNRVNDGFLATVQGAAESTQIVANVYGGVNHQSHAFARFCTIPNDRTALGATSGITNYYLYAEREIYEHPKMQYFLLGKEDATYVGMAKRYQKYLLDTGVLGERLTEQEHLPLYLDFTGYFTTDASVVGIPYTKVNTLSTVEDIQKSVDTLAGLGVTNITARLRAYGNGGTKPSITDGFYLEKKVGTVDQLKALASSLSKQGGTLYLDDNLGVVYNDGTFDAFMRQKHASRTLTKLTAIDGTYNPVSNSSENRANRYYLVSPMFFNTLASDFADGFMKKVGTTEGFGYSWAMFGQRVWSDFEASRMVDSSSARDLATEAVETAKKTFGTVMTDGGNQYSIRLADVLLNVPSTNSLYDSISYPVPFLEMVLHGYKDYASAPFNLAANMRSNRLASIEGGANVYYSCYTEPDEIMKEVVDRSIQYPTGINGLYDQIAADYQEFDSQFARLRTQLIVNHERLAKSVYCTTYEDGTRVFVNYSDIDAETADTTVPANGYVIL